MKIIGIDILHVSGGWDNWSYLKVMTDEGLVGWSEFNQARGRRGLAAVVEGLSELVIGEDPREVGRLAARLYSVTQSTSGGLQALAIAAYENACLDIKAKALGVPVHQLFGGALRDSLPVYWSHCGMYRSRHHDLFEKTIGKPAVRGLDDMIALGREVRQSGYAALKTNLLMFEAGRPATVGRGTGPFEMNIDKQLVRKVVAQLDALREGAGPDVGLLMDLNFNYKTEGFLQLARAVERFDMTWLEMDTQSPAALAFIRQNARTPIASLEAVLGRRALKPYLDAQAVDVAIVDVVFNGMLESFKMAAFADAYEVNVAAHNSHGPLGTLMSAHFCTAIPNFRVLEFDVDEVPWRQSLLTASWTMAHGRLTLPSGPGWGADLNEEIARAHPARK